MENERSSPHYQWGPDPDVAYVFSAPGSEEEYAGRPAAGKTGMHLAILIAILRDWGLTVLPYREQAVVTNAWPDVHYESKTGRTEATDSEIKDPQNLERLASEIGHIRKWILCFGAKAYLAVSELKKRGLLQESCQVVKAKHLSPRVIHYINRDIHGNPIEGGGFTNLCRRLEVLADEILAQMDPGKHRKLHPD